MTINVPAWIDQTISPYDIAGILQGGCASGAYMPAVTYTTAVKTMAEHGDEVLAYIEQSGMELDGDTLVKESWSGIAVYFLSVAVELWCSEHEHLADWENDDPIDGDDED